TICVAAIRLPAPLAPIMTVTVFPSKKFVCARPGAAIATSGKIIDSASLHVRFIAPPELVRSLFPNSKQAEPIQGAIMVSRATLGCCGSLDRVLASAFSEDTMKRKHASPKARKRAQRKVSAIDIHAHFVPEEYLRILGAEGEPRGVGLRSTPTGAIIQVGPVPIGPITAPYHDLDLRLKEMDKIGVAVHALSLRPPTGYLAAETRARSPCPG